MAYRVEVLFKSDSIDPRGRSLKHKINGFLNINIDHVRISDVFTVDADIKPDMISFIAGELFCDPVIQRPNLTGSLDGDFDYFLEVGFLPGVTDNVGRTSRQAIETIIGRKLGRHEDVYTSQLYALKGRLTRNDVEFIANELLHNPLIQQYHVYEPGTRPAVYIPRVTLRQQIAIEKIDITAFSDERLAEISKERLLALSLKELHTIQGYFSDDDFLKIRAQYGLSGMITDVELECLAQTWSEHCKHKIFNAIIEYEDEFGNRERIDGLFKSCVRASTEKIAESGKRDFLVSVFVDNAGVIRFTDDWNLVFKVETHNSPSALDPYGGALTGIVGVNRDVLGTGIGARLIFNTDVFCFADPFYHEQLPPRILHPRRIYDGVVTGVEHGGNKSGIPTINGSLVFDNRFLGKPLVYCGTGGLMPAVINGKPSHEKSISDGDLIVMSGGRIGKDGIHGATFSSEELHEGSPATAVQIGDPITQKKMADFLFQARDRGLYCAITDNGAGGLSSSVGEMSQFSNGCQIHLDRTPLKYTGLNPWEILVSESQERMSFAVPPDRIERFLELSAQYDVESTVIGTFTATGLFHVLYSGETCALMPIEFLHNGLPRMELAAKFQKHDFPEKPDVKQNVPCGEILRSLLSSLNICSKESVVRRYDHEVQGMSVVKPFTGQYNDGPSDASVIKPLPESWEGVVVSHGICPKFSDYDTYNMAALALDEAVRNAVACGGDIDRMACLDNFCWCDPVKSDKTPDGEHKLAQLVRANKALYDYTVAYGVPCISGKDSMKNDYLMGGVKISIPPTLLFSLIGVIGDVRRCVTMDFKKPGDLICIAGITSDELAGSEYLRLLGIRGGKLPSVNAVTNRKIYAVIRDAISRGLINSCHDCSDGGIAVALAEMCFSGGLGCSVDLDKLPCSADIRNDFVLFSESAGRLVFSIPPERETEVQDLFRETVFAVIGNVNNSNKLEIFRGNTPVIDEDTGLLKECWQKTLRDI